MNERDHPKLIGEAVESEDGFKPVLCPNPKCGQIFFDLDDNFWMRGNADIECRKCKQRVENVSVMQDERRPGKMIYLYRCDSCNLTFTRKVPAIMKYCPGCRTKYRIFWHLLLKLPSYSSAPSLRKVPLKSVE